MSELIPKCDRESAILLTDGELYFSEMSSKMRSGARDAILVLTTGRKAGGDARRGGEETRDHGESMVAGGVPGDTPGTAVCYGHCW